MKLFIDGGTHYGEGFKQFKKILNITKDWTVLMFEPNPACEIFKQQQYLNDFFKGKLHLYDYAIWTHDKTINFNQATYIRKKTYQNRTNNHDGVEGSIVTSIMKNKNIFNPAIKVKCVDLGRIIQQYKAYEIYIKLDIEGAEFSVIRDLINRDLIKHIKTLYVEWHSRLLISESQQTTKNICRQIKKSNPDIQLFNWK